jgi:LacI family transcriptional regulator
MVTLRHIAKHCGVSIASVSKALNFMPGVSAKTGEMIRTAAMEMNYLPNAAAKTLKTNRSFNIGVLLEDDSHHGLLHGFFVTVLEGFKVTMEKKGYDLMLMNRTIGLRTISYLEHCRHSNLDGVFVACMDFTEPELLELAESDYPLVSIDHSFPGHSSVYSDNTEGTRLAVEYAHQLGHKKIAYVCGGMSGVTERRIMGYRKGLKMYGLPYREDYLPRSRYRDVQATRSATASLLRLADPPTCILLPDDYAALGAKIAAEEAGMRVPRDVSLIGFDGLEIFENILPRLTTVRQDAFVMGERAAELLLECIEGRAEGTEWKSIIVPISLIKGGTVTTPV